MGLQTKKHHWRPILGAENGEQGNWQQHTAIGYQKVSPVVNEKNRNQWLKRPSKYPSVYIHQELLSVMEGMDYIRLYPHQYL